MHLTEMGNEIVDYIPGLPPTRIADLSTCLYGKGHTILARALGSLSSTQTKAQHLLLSSVYELKPQVIDSLSAKYPIPIYHVGPNIPTSKSSTSPIPSSQPMTTPAAAISNGLTSNHEPPSCTSHRGVFSRPREPSWRKSQRV